MHAAVVLSPQLGHSGAVIGLDVSPDGRVLATAGSDRTVRLWDTATQRELRVLIGHTKDLRQVRFAPNGRWLASAGKDATVRVWEVESGRLQTTLTGHRGGIEALAFSPDGRLLATGGLDAAVVLWDVASGLKQAELVGHAARVYGVSFSSDGQRLASVGREGALIVWDVNTGRSLQRTMVGKTRHALAYSPDGRWLVHEGTDHTIVLLDLKQGTGASWAGHKGLINDLRWASDSQTLVSASMDKTVRVWRVGQNEPSQVIQTGSAMLWRAVPAPDGQSVYTAHGGKAVVRWSRETGREIAWYKGWSAKVFGLALANSGMSLVSAGDDAVTHWVLNDLPRTRSLDSELTGISSLALRDKPLMAVYGSQSGHVAVRDLSEPGRPRPEKVVYFKQRVPVHAVAVSSDGRWGAAGGDEPGIHVWELAAPQNMRVLPGHHGPVRALGFAPGGQLFSGGQDKMVRMWQPETAELLRQFGGHQQAVTGLATDAAGKKWATASWDTTLRLGQGLDDEINPGTKLTAGQSWITSVALSADGHWLAAGSADRLLRLWSTRQGSEVREFAGHEAGVQAVAFAPDGRRIYSAGRDTTIRIWDRETGKEQLQLIPFEQGGWLMITPQGYFASSGPDVEASLVVRWGNGLFDVTDISAYRERFFRPDLVQAVLDARANGQEPSRIRDVALAPVVEVVLPPSEAPTEALNLALRLTDRGGGIGEVRVSVNGSTVASVSGRSPVQVSEQPTMTVPVRLDAGPNLIRIVAFNTEGSMRSEPVTVQVQGRFTSTHRPSMHVLVVGIDQFANPRLTLRNAVADARAVALTLKAKATGLFETVHVTELTSPADTTRASILAALQRHTALNPGDVFVLFIASHGMVQGDRIDRQDYYLLTSNVGSTSTAALGRDAISQHELKRVLAAIPARKKLMLFDTCYAGALGESLQNTPGTRGLAEDAALRILGDAMGSTIVSAASSVQQALEGFNGHGLFTWVLIEGLNGKAVAQGRQYVSTADISSYIEDEVPRLALDKFKAAQYPVPINSGRAFPLTAIGNGVVLPAVEVPAAVRRAKAPRVTAGEGEIEGEIE